MTTTLNAALPAMYPGDLIILPSGARGRFIRWSVPISRASESGRERVAIVELDGSEGETKFSAAYAAKFRTLRS